MAADAIHPGEHIAAELKVLDVNAAAFARQLQLPENRITEILNSRQAVTADVALKLADYFGTSAKFWVSLQRLYNRRIAEYTSADNY
jgi:addiction module HigA family antidote